jgi:hypothetical protein
MSANFSLAEIRQLAEIERDMDSGRLPFVMHAGQRLAVPRPILEELGLIAGQTVSDTIEAAITRRSAQRMNEAWAAYQQLLAAAIGARGLIKAVLDNSTWPPDFPRICNDLEAAIAKLEQPL